MGIPNLGFETIFDVQNLKCLGGSLKIASKISDSLKVELTWLEPQMGLSFSSNTPIFLVVKPILQIMLCCAGADSAQW